MSQFPGRLFFVYICVHAQNDSPVDCRFDLRLLFSLLSDLCLVAYYIHENEVRWGLITFAIIFLPLMICQLCSLLMMRTQKAVETPVLVVHLFLMGIPYRLGLCCDAYEWLLMSFVEL